MVGNMQVSYRICLNTINDDNLTIHEKAIHNPLVTRTIEYHSTQGDVDLKNEIAHGDNELQLPSEIKQTYKCCDCSYSTNWSSNLRRHEKFKQNPSGIKQIYKCQDCTYSTNWSSSLRRHEKTMHKPSLTSPSEIKQMYKCRDCAYSTNWLSNLTQHEKDVHNPSGIEQMYKCRDCSFLLIGNLV